MYDPATIADFKRRIKEFPLEELRDTGLKCPIEGDPLFYIGQIDEEAPGRITYCSMRDGIFQRVYTKEKEEPYYKTNWDSFDSQGESKWPVYRNRFFVPDSSGLWTEFKTHFTWASNQSTIYLPVDMSEEEVKKTIEILQDEEGGVGNIMPIAARVAAKTIGMDLVAVTPMSGPKMSLMYLDYTYPGLKYEYSNRQTPRRPRRKKNIRFIKKKNGTDRIIPGRKSRIHLYQGGKRWKRNPYTPLLQ